MSVSVQNSIVSQYSYVNKKLCLSVNQDKVGLFAESEILAGEAVAVWGGKVLHRDDLSSVISKSLIHQIDEDLYLAIPTDSENMESIHYINTSQEPNCEFVNPITLKAKYNIGKGEEITYSAHQSRTAISNRSQKIEQLASNVQGFAAGAWGLLTSIDLEECDPALIRDAEAIKQYVYELCELIAMKRFGECHVVHFGEDERVAGYSMFQLIETSCISAHFANETNTSYLDIFSCKEYDPLVVSEFSKKYFKGGKLRMTVT